MEQLNINHILNRNQEEKKFIECLEHFEKEKQNILTKVRRSAPGQPTLVTLTFLQKQRNSAPNQPLVTLFA